MIDYYPYPVHCQLDTKGQFSENWLNTANFLYVVFSLLKWRFFHNLESQHLLHLCQAFDSFIAVRGCSMQSNYHRSMGLSTGTGKLKFSLDFFLPLTPRHRSWIADDHAIVSQLWNVNYHFSTEPFGNVTVFLMYQFLSFLLYHNFLMTVQFCFETFGTCFKGKFYIVS